MAGIYNDLLLQGIQELYDRNKVSLDVKTDVDDYITKNVDTSYIDITYPGFNQVLSTGLTFTDATRVATSISSFALITNKIIDLAGKKISAVFPKMSTVIASLTYSISYDGITFFSINVTNGFSLIPENITGDFYLKISGSGAADFSKIMLMYYL